MVRVAVPKPTLLKEIIANQREAIHQPEQVADEAGPPANGAAIGHERAADTHVSREIEERLGPGQVRIVAASEVVSMDDAVEVALRRKKDSSMRVAVSQVRAGAAHVAISAGNTGALMAVARYLLKTLEGIDRPAIAFQLPNSLGTATTVLDLGANVDCQAEHLLQFAVMGSALVSVLQGKEQPTVGLLNIGEEAIKGNEVIRQTRELLLQAASSGDLNFYGNVEGDDIFKGTTDIVVCDGFVGNVALKTSEGLASMVASFLKQEFSRNLFTKAAAVVARLGPRVGIVQERPVDRVFGKDIHQVARIAGMDADIFDAGRADLAQKHGHAVDKGLTADDADFGIAGGHMDHVLAAAKADLKPHGFGSKAKQARRIKPAFFSVSFFLSSQIKASAIWD